MCYSWTNYVNKGNNKKPFPENNNVFKWHKGNERMKRNLLVVFLGLILVVLIAGFVLAGPNPPGGPAKIFAGNIYVNGVLLSDGSYTLTAWIGSSAVAQTTVSGGKYSNLQISTSDNYGTIIFYVNGVQATETGTWNNDKDSDWGQKITLDLNLSSKPSSNSLCGNGLVNLGEECDGTNLAGRTSCGTGWTGTISCSSTCVIDYSNCTKTQDTSTNTGSSGGNGGSSHPSGGSGGGSSRSVITTATTSNTTTNVNSTENNSAGNETSTNNETPVKTGRGFFTGAAVGVGDFVVSYWWAILVVLLVVAYFFVRSRLKKRSKSNSFK